MLDTLKKYFGYTSFRPYQEETISALLSGRDAFLLMPTGGGKSLCYQLPALLSEGIGVVVSSLIALMKDQVDQLNALGIPATFINSSLDPSEVEERIRALESKTYKLLYVAPERLNTGGFLKLLGRLKIGFFAIDEAHCISEWGHDFRRDYRDLSLLKKRWPGVPIIAMTATATPRVEEDIIKELGLRNPHRAEASFNRPNLFYSVLPKQAQFSQLVRFLDTRKGQAGIIYCFSKDGTERLATALQQQGFRAVPYHAGLDTTLRTKNQEKFSRDEADIVCATIAFGMGINKSNVRFVVHYDLPKHLAGYYQETGRAGRDGLPADCLLFFGLGDQSKQLYFIDQKESADERAIAVDELNKMVTFAQTRGCRRAQLLAYFKEEFTAIPCGGCDNCNPPKKVVPDKTVREPHVNPVAAPMEITDSYDATRQAQMFLSCMVRVKQNFGSGHIIDILRGSENEKVMQFRHHTLPTYGIGKDYTTKEWRWLCSEFMRLGYIRQDADHYGVLRIEPSGWAVLRNSKSVMLQSPPESSSGSPSRSTQFGSTSTEALPANNESLFQQLRVLRKRIADHENLAPFVIFHDTTLREMAALLPLDEPALLRISGVGESKAKNYGKEFLSAIREAVESNPALGHTEIDRGPGQPEKEPNQTAYQSGAMLSKGLTLEQVAKERGLTMKTIEEHAAQLIANGNADLFHQLVTKSRHEILHAAFEKIGWHVLKPVLEYLQATQPADFPLDYGDLRLVRAYEQSLRFKNAVPLPLEKTVASGN
jgi:ATP-dependent DNA helicase RecQ